MDPVVAGRPIALQSKDGHALWVSSKVLESISSLPDEVEGGVIVRDEDGNPTGETDLATGRSFYRFLSAKIYYRNISR